MSFKIKKVMLPQLAAISGELGGGKRRHPQPSSTAP